MAADTKLADAVRSGTALYAVLWPHKDAIAKRWVDAVHGTYPFETIGFLRTRKDQFANPVGYRTESAAAAVMDVLFEETPNEEVLGNAVEEIIRVRAIQNFPPETAVGIFFAMKDIVREVVEASGQAAQCRIALQALESRIDAVVLMAFGAYARCREKLHLLKVEEFKRSHAAAFRMAQRQGNLNLEEADTQNP